MSFSLILSIVLYYLILIILSFFVNITISILFPIFKSVIKNIFNIWQKEKNICVKIISKRVYTFEDDGNDGFENYYLSFEDENNKVFELLVDNYYYNFYFEGERGLLTYKGTKFIDFVREKN